MSINEIKLTLEQANLGFILLDKMHDHFPDNIELTIPVLEILLREAKAATEVENDNS